MPLRNWIWILNCCLINPWIHSLRIYSWITLFFLLKLIRRFLRIYSISWSSILISWKWWRWLAYNIVPLWKSIYIFDCCLINPRIHSIRIYCWILRFLFSLMLIKTTFWFLNLLLLFLRLFWRRIWSWNFVIKHTFFYEIINIWVYFFMSNVIL